MKSFSRAVAGFVVLSLVLLGCAGEESPDATTETPQEEPAATTPEGESTDSEEVASDVSFDLKIGLALPFTGGLAFAGPPLSEGATIATDLINEALEGLDLSDSISVSIVAREDTQTEPGPSLEAATKLVQVDNADVVIGPLASTSFISVAESVTIPNGVLLICPTCSAPQISDLDDNNLVFRTLPSDALQGRITAEVIAEEFGSDATVNVGARNDAFGVALKDEFETRWEELGGSIGESVTYDPEAPSLDTEAGRIASGDPDAWVIIDFPDNFAKLGPALVRAGGWDPARTFVNGAMRSEEDLAAIGEQATQGLRGVAPTSDSPVGDEYRSVFEERSPEDVDSIPFDAAAFDAVMLAFFGALAAGSAEPVEMQEHLQAVSGPAGTKYSFQDLEEAIQAVLAGEEIDYEGAWGAIDWDENGDPTSSVVEIFEFRDGTITVLDTYEAN